MKFKPPVINFGTKRVKGLPDSKQPKDINKEWFVYFGYWSELESKYKTFKYRNGINYFHSIKERWDAAKVLRDDLHSLLNEGFNPLLGKEISIRNTVSESNTDSIAFGPVLDALLWGLNKKSDKDKIANKTYQTYNNCCVHFCEGLAAAGLRNLCIAELSRKHILSGMMAVQEQRGISNKRYNTIVNNLHTVIETLCEFEVLESNPTDKIKPLAVVAAEPFKQPENFDEFKKVMEDLKRQSFDLWRFLVLFYHSGLRPSEILYMKWANIQFDTRSYKIIPEIIENKGKDGITRNYRTRKTNSIKEGRFSEEAWQIIIYQLGAIENYRPVPTDYIFGTKYLPSPTHMKRDTVTKHFKKIAKDGMGVKWDAYGIRGMSGGVLVDSIEDIALAQKLLGHEQSEQTKHYIKRRIAQLQEDSIAERKPNIQ